VGEHGFFAPLRRLIIPATSKARQIRRIMYGILTFVAGERFMSPKYAHLLDRTVRYHESGSGRTCILLHAFP
jgi:hypothetical protein